MFGTQAILVRISDITKGGKDEYNGLIYTHQNINRSVGNVTMPGAIDMDAEVSMSFDPTVDGKERTIKTMTLRDIIRRIYVKIGGRKIPVFLYAFKTPQGHYQLWFWDTVPQIRDFVTLFARQGAAYVWHQCRCWGWQQGPMKRLFQASFSPEIGHSAMNSKWCSHRNCAVEIEMSPEAAALLNFGSSPFILKEGEDKASRQKTETKGVISRGNIKPNEIGGMDADDLVSLRDESNAQTVFQDEDDEDEYEDDDVDDNVSSMGDEDDIEDDEENTVAQDDEDGDEYMEDAGEDDDGDSAFSTVDSRRKDLDGLKESGRSVRGEADEGDSRARIDVALHDRIEELEEEKLLMQQDMKQKVSALENMMAELMKQLAAKTAAETGEASNMNEQADGKRSADNEEHSGLGAADTGEKEGYTSPETGDSGAPAGIK